MMRRYGQNQSMPNHHTGPAVYPEKGTP